MMKKRNSSQIATIIVFIIAVIFLFTLISMNIARVAHKKTAIDNIADTVGLTIASQLGSIANALKQSLGIYGSDNKKCNVNWQLILGAIIVVVSAILLVVLALPTFGVSLAALPAALVAAASFVGPLGLAMLGYTGINLLSAGIDAQFAASNPGVQKAMQVKFQSMSLKQQIIESTIQGLLFSTVDDPAWVTDNFDMDKDTDHSDKVPRFSKWYNLRLAQLPSVGNLVKEFLRGDYPGLVGVGGKKYSFFMDENDLSRFKIEEDVYWMAKDLSDYGYPEEYAKWWVDPSESGTNTRSLVLTKWIDNDYGLRGMLRKMRNYGYGINANMVTMRVTVKDEKNQDKVITRYVVQSVTDLPEEPEPALSPIPEFQASVEYAARYEDKALNFWIDTIKEFEGSMVKSLYNMDLDGATQGVSFWMSLFAPKEVGYDPYKDLYNTTGFSTPDYWLKRLALLRKSVREFRTKLEERMRQINDCVYECKREKWFCASTDNTKPICNELTTMCCTTGPSGLNPQCGDYATASQCTGCNRLICCHTALTGGCATQCCDPTITTDPVTNTTTITTECQDMSLSLDCRKCDDSLQCQRDCYYFNPSKELAQERTGLNNTPRMDNCQYMGCCGPMIYCGAQCDGDYLPGPVGTPPPDCPVKEQEAVNYSYDATCLRQPQYTSLYPMDNIPNGYDTKCESPIHEVGQEGAETFCCEVTNLAPFDENYVKETHNCISGKPNHNIVQVFPYRTTTNLSEWPDGIEQYDALWVLDKFLEDLDQLVLLVSKFNTDVIEAERKSYNEFNETIYVWSDFVGGVSSEKQEVGLGHAIYARLEFLNGQDFQLPYPYPSTEWLSTCVEIKEAENQFTLHVARYDEGAAKKGPLSKFWTFILSKVGAGETALLDKLHTEAQSYSNGINTNAYYQVSGNNRNDIIALLRNGIASTVRVNYGPGYTLTPEEKENLDSRPDLQKLMKEDISINSTSSSM